MPCAIGAAHGLRARRLTGELPHARPPHARPPHTRPPHTRPPHASTVIARVAGTASPAGAPEPAHFLKSPLPCHRAQWLRRVSRLARPRPHLPSPHPARPDTRRDGPSFPG